MRDWVNLLARNQEGFSALHTAAFKGNLKTVRFLTENEADYSIKNPSGNNCVHTAAQGDQPAVIYFLVKHCGLCVNDTNNV